MVIGKIKGIHRYRRPLNNGTFRYYYKVSREKGAPIFWTCDGRPEKEPVSQAFITAYEEKKAEWFQATPALEDTIAGLVKRHRTTDEFKALSKSSKQYYEEAYPHILAEFGEDEIAVFEDPNMRRDVKNWRSKWKATPRQADKMLGSLVTLLNFAIDEGDIARHVLHGIKRLHSADRSYIIWEDADILAFSSDASEQLKWVIDFGTMTGLRREDIATIPANADKGTHLEWEPSKSRGKLTVIIPIISQLRIVLDNIKLRKQQLGAVTTTLLCNSRGKPWTGRGLSASFRKQAKKHEINKTMHDMRGTAVTRFKLAGLEDDEIAAIVGWKKEHVTQLIKRYVSKEVVIRELVHKVEQERLRNSKL